MSVFNYIKENNNKRPCCSNAKFSVVLKKGRQALLLSNLGHCSVSNGYLDSW